METVKNRKAFLTGQQLQQLYMAIQRTVASDPSSRKAVDSAIDEVGRYLEARMNLDGSVAMNVPKGSIECEFGVPYAVFGIKMALVQGILGGPGGRDLQPHIMTRYVFLPIAEAVGIKKLVTKEARLEDPADNGLSIKFDEEK